MSELHHATLVRTAAVRDFLLAELGEFEEVQDDQIEQFGIDNARRLVSTACNRPISATRQTLVVRTEFITHEAQNALLKILEEPPQTTQIIFVVPESLQILPTLASRFFEWRPAGAEDNEVTEEFEQFLKDGHAERLVKIESAIKNKDISWQQGIKAGLLQHLRSFHGGALAELELVARFLLTRGASNKFLLEHLALTLPTRPC